MNRSNNNIICLGDVLAWLKHQLLRRCMNIHGRHTLPPLFSTHNAFFLRSMQSGPAKVVVTVEGGVCRRPGPSLSGAEGLGGIGSTSSDRISPGITKVWVILIGAQWKCSFSIRIRTGWHTSVAVGEVVHIFECEVHPENTFKIDRLNLPFSNSSEDRQTFFFFLDFGNYLT